MACLREVRAVGTAEQRGVTVGSALKGRILALHEMGKLAFPVGTDESIDQWDDVASAGLAQARTWTPIAVAELEGMAAAEGLDMGLLCRIQVFYEMVRVNTDVKAAWGKAGVVGGRPSEIAQSWAAGDHKAHLSTTHECTSFVEWRADGSILAAQTNDEPSFFFDGGNADCVVRLDGEGIGAGGEVLTLTHPGMVAFKGTNAAGLHLCVNAIDNGERDLFGGVPRPYVARELLTKQSLPEAVELLKHIPKTFPLVYVLSQVGYGCVAIETSPTQCVESWGAPCHFLCWGNSVQLLHEPADDKKRDSCLALLEATRGEATTDGLSVAAAFGVLQEPPVFSEGTLESFVCDAEALHVRFRTHGEMDAEWQTFSFGSKLMLPLEAPQITRNSTNNQQRKRSRIVM